MAENRFLKNPKFWPFGGPYGRVYGADGRKKGRWGGFWTKTSAWPKFYQNRARSPYFGFTLTHIWPLKKWEADAVACLWNLVYLLHIWPEQVRSRCCSELGSRPPWWWSTCVGGPRDQHPPCRQGTRCPVKIHNYNWYLISYLVEKNNLHIRLTKFC